MPDDDPLGRQHWIAAALDALVEGGLAAVAVEPLARVLDVTKGSFYWHFKGRSELVSAAAEHWARVGADLVAQLAEIDDPAERVRRFLSLARSVPRHVRIEGALSAAATHPAVAPTMAGVVASRLAFLEAAYAELGCDDAAERATVSYAFYLGTVHLLRTASGRLSDHDALSGYFERAAALHLSSS